jgi:hypothetical protein
MDYHDFELHVTPDERIRAVSDEQGEVGDHLRLDLNEIELTLELIELGRTNADLLKALGATLYQALLPPDIHAHFRACLAGARAADRGLRIRLVVEPPELSGLPWEFLYDSATNTFLANSTETALSRYIPYPMPRREIRDASPPLQVLLVISGPADLDPLDAASEEALIREALSEHLADGLVALDVVTPATIRNINQKLREKPYNLFHFIGHGTFEGETGYVALQDRDGLARMVDDETFSNFFLGNRSLGLAVLNACQGATALSRQALAGVAPHLVRRGVPAVVAMQYSVRDSTAQIFADQFYRTLALNWPVDATVQTTRNAISMEVGLGQPDFATPVLFMRARDGVVLSSTPGV